MKEKLIDAILAKATRVQALDTIVIGEVLQTRELHTNEKVFEQVYEIVLTAAQGMGIVEVLQQQYALTAEELSWIAELHKGYEEVKQNCLKIYRAHVKKNG